MEITLLKNILTGAGTTMTQDEINAESGCFTCFGMTLGQANVLVLLNAISDAFGGGGGGGGALSANLSGAGSPVGVVTPTALNQFYRDTTGNALYQSTGLTSADWINWI
jgi:hypothetical protein